MTTSATAPAPAPVRVDRIASFKDLLRWPWPPLLVAMAYVVLSTLDVKFGPIPLKFVLTTFALLVWALARRTQLVDLLRTRPGQGVVALGIVLPAIWFVVAAVRIAMEDPSQLHGLRDAFDVGSRFVYLLFALPLMDLFTHASDRIRDGLLGAVVLLLGVATLGLVGAHLGGAVLDHEKVGPFSGAFGVEPATGTFRAFFVNQILFVPPFCLLLVLVIRRGVAWVPLVLIGVALASLFYSHSRGLWTAMTVSCLFILVAASPLGHLLDRPKVRWLAILAVIGSIFVLSAPHLVKDAASAVTGGANELSASTRLDQGPELVAGFLDHPVIGSGMAAYLPSGFRRSEATPWSFEQTYLQLLFQMGIVGFALFFASLAPSLVRGWKSVFSAPHTTDEPYALAGIGALAGLVFAYASNPYLLTSPGMLALAIALALLVTARAAGAADERPAPPRAASDAPAP